MTSTALTIFVIIMLIVASFTLGFAIRDIWAEAQKDADEAINNLKLAKDRMKRVANKNSN